MIKYLEFKGEKLPYKVGYGVMKHFKKDTGTSLTEIKNEDFEAQEVILYHALRVGHALENKEFTLQKSDMESIFDWKTNFTDFIESFADFFPEKVVKEVNKEEKNVKGGKNNPPKVNQ